MGLKKLTLAMINARDYKLLKDWYLKALGLEITEEEDEGQWSTFKLPGGGAEFAVHGGIPPESGTPKTVACIEVEDIRSTVEELRARGVEVIKDVHGGQGPEGLLLADIRDPEGNWINLYEAVGGGTHGT